MKELFDGLLKPLVAAILAAIVANCNAGCKPADFPEMAKAYHAEIALCVANAATVEDSGACRGAVDLKYGVCDHPEWNLGRCEGL